MNVTGVGDTDTVECSFSLPLIQTTVFRNKMTE